MKTKKSPVWYQSSEEATLIKKPYYNAYICKTGPHGDLKYNRNKNKRNSRYILQEY